MRFEWDSQKAESNFEKHKVRFDVAQRVFLMDNRLFLLYAISTATKKTKK
jgi:uncharacterized DUF497 family protein